MKYILSHLPETILLLFTAITFLQSGLDKVIDWKGNLQWLQSHFSKTFLKSSVAVLLGIITILEVLSGLFAVWGIASLSLEGDKGPAQWAAALSCLTLLMLLFGQRVAKDYDGARTIVIYFMPAIFLVFLLF